LFYWPFYLLYAAYSGIRFTRQDTQVRVWQAAVAAAIVACALTPAAMNALRISREAGAHAFNELPTLRNLLYLVHGFPILICIAAGWGLRKWRKWPVQPGAGLALAAMWWLVCPVCLFAYSKLSGNGVLIMRYASLMLPGIALTVTAILGRFLPAENWRPAAVCLGLLALGLTGDWTHLWPAHEHDDWRDAASWERSVFEHSGVSGDTPVLCPSPFVEAQTPVWRPDYPIDSFLASHLGFYPLKGRLMLMPFQPSAESDRYLDDLLRKELPAAGTFVVYGSTRKVEALEKRIAMSPRWHRETREFDNLSVAIYRL
jgi:hypothetical protein